MVSIKVVCALLISLAFAMSCAISCGWFDKKFFVKLGAPVFSVLSYGNFKASNTFAIEAAAHNSTETPVKSLILLIILFSSLIKFFLIFSAFSTSTLTPLNLISTRQGNNFVSMSNTSQRNWSSNWTFILCQSFKVDSASRSAYWPTNIDGSFHISFLGSIPYSFAAACNTASSLPMPTYSFASVSNL